MEDCLYGTVVSVRLWLSSWMLYCTVSLRFTFLSAEGEPRAPLTASRFGQPKTDVSGGPDERRQRRDGAPSEPGPQVYRAKGGDAGRGGWGDVTTTQCATRRRRSRNRDGKIHNHTSRESRSRM